MAPIDCLDVNGVPQRLQRSLVKTLALGWMRKNRPGNVFEARAHLDCKTEGCRQLRNPGTDALDAEQDVCLPALRCG